MASAPKLKIKVGLSMWGALKMRIARIELDKEIDNKNQALIDYAVKNKDLSLRLKTQTLLTDQQEALIAKTRVILRMNGWQYMQNSRTTVKRLKRLYNLID